MKHLLLTTVAAVLLVGCGGASGIQKAAISGNIEAVKQYLDGGADVNAMDDFGDTPLDGVEKVNNWNTPEDKVAKNEIADLLRKHGGKTGEELKAEGK